MLQYVVDSGLNSLYKKIMCRHHVDVLIPPDDLREGVGRCVHCRNMVVIESALPAQVDPIDRLIHRHMAKQPTVLN